MALDRRVEEILSREIENLGFELVKVECFFPGRRGILRIFIDRADPPVTIDDCVRVTKAIGLVLDDLEAMAGPYNLEVSSPGSHRPLVKPAHFLRFRGERARVTYLDERGVRATSTGDIAGADEERIVIEIDDTQLIVPFERLLRANLQPDDGMRSAADRPRRGRRARRGKTF
jgi:ribosome maturation factor RimP